MPDKTLEHEQLTEKIIGAAIEVHRRLGPGFHFAIVRSYLRAAGRRHGLLLNFLKPTLEVKRVICG
ncbi:MAG: hypothetical protein FJ290_14320 [Planctomycetes bacterium]|nr:hypothetical protein [Planctomycetota bacterium]